MTRSAHCSGRLGAVAAVSVCAVLAPLTTPWRPTVAQFASDSAAVAQVVERYHQALVDGDSLAALALLAQDAVILESGGLESREEYRSHHLPADIAFAGAVKGTRSPVKTWTRGDVAWTTATSLVRGNYQKRVVNSTGAELMVLTRTAGGWKIRAIHWSSHDRP